MIFSPIATIDSKLDSISINNGQQIICTDSKDTFVDIDNERIKIGDIILLDEESDRESILAPIPNKLYLVKNTNKLYRHDGSKWFCFNNTTKSQRRSYILTSNTPKLELKIEGLDVTKDTVIVFLNSVYLEEESYILTNDYLTPTGEGNIWNATIEDPIYFNLIIIKNLPEDNNKYIERKFQELSKDYASLLYIMMINNMKLEGYLTLDKLKEIYKNNLWTNDMFKKAIELNVLTQEQFNNLSK